MHNMTNLVLIPNTSKNIEKGEILSLIEDLQSAGCHVGLPEDCREPFAYLKDRVTWFPDREAYAACDAAVVLGGDGSIISAAHRLLGLSVPIIGINFGHIGFLAEIEMSEIGSIHNLLSREYTIEERMMLDAVVTDRAGRRKGAYTVLNDIVLTNGPIAHLISFDVRCDGMLMETCRADGFIAATPTGSTAYSLSAGGPVLEPTLEAICLTPICPHTLSTRPIIVRGNSVIRLENFNSKDAAVFLNADGMDDVPIENGDTVEIRRSQYITKLIRIRERGFYHALHHKLSEK